MIDIRDKTPCIGMIRHLKENDAESCGEAVNISLIPNKIFRAAGWERRDAAAAYHLTSAGFRCFARRLQSSDAPSFEAEDIDGFIVSIQWPALVLPIALLLPAPAVDPMPEL